MTVKNALVANVARLMSLSEVLCNSPWALDRNKGSDQTSRGLSKQ